MARTCPLRQPSALFISVYKSLHYFAVYIGVHESEKREKSSEGIPETIIGEHVSGKYFAIIWTVMYNLIFCIYFKELARKQEHPVKTRIECSLLVGSPSLNSN